MRQLAHHEQKLLKKVDFLQWKSTENVREVKIIRRYHLQKREDYIKYVAGGFVFCSGHPSPSHLFHQMPFLLQS